jgi:hypothetical protein
VVPAGATQWQPINAGVAAGFTARVIATRQPFSGVLATIGVARETTRLPFCPGNTMSSVLRRLRRCYGTGRVRSASRLRANEST